jgi:TP53 regulating kinase and related kinases
MNSIFVNQQEFQIVKLLGKGKGGYSYLATHEGKKYVVKQIHHEPCDYYNFGNKIEAEINDYNRLKGVGIKIPNMIDVDTTRETILKDYIEGDTAYTMIKEDRLPKECIDQVKQMCEKLYPEGINIDYFPTNFIFEKGILYYIDFECNGYMDEWNFENWGIKYWSKTKEFLDYVNTHKDL